MYPTQHQWALLEAYKQYPFPITPLQFLQIYDELSYRELAKILGLSISSVEHFFCDRTEERLPGVYSKTLSHLSRNSRPLEAFRSTNTRANSGLVSSPLNSC
jgi:hypothetical protein